MQVKNIVSFAFIGFIFSLSYFDVVSTIPSPSTPATSSGLNFPPVSPNDESFPSLPPESLEFLNNNVKHYIFNYSPQNSPTDNDIDIPEMILIYTLPNKEEPDPIQPIASYYLLAHTLEQIKGLLGSEHQPSRSDTWQQVRRLILSDPTSPLWHPRSLISSAFSCRSISSASSCRPMPTCARDFLEFVAFLTDDGKSTSTASLTEVSSASTSSKQNSEYVAHMILEDATGGTLFHLTTVLNLKAETLEQLESRIPNAPGSSSWVTETASQMSVDSMPKQHTSSGIIRAHSNVVPKIDLPKPRSGCKSAPK